MVRHINTYERPDDEMSYAEIYAELAHTTEPQYNKRPTNFKREINRKNINAAGTKFYVSEGEREVARAYLYILNNDLHKEPFGFIEDVFVDPSLRGNGLGSSLVDRIIKEARERGCYKIICCSKYGNDKTHNWYLNFGFKDNGKEFRMNF